MYKNFIKRFIDIVLSLISIVVLLPLFLIISIVIKIDSKGPVFFSQTRIGKKQQMFTVHKFRSMLTYEESFLPNGKEIPNNERVTRVGKFLRNTSLDELPQLFNILKGEMSLIGPRPTLEYQVKRYNDRQFKRLDVRPGLTGLAQVNGRNQLTWEQKINFDIEYVEHISFLLDLRIFLKTFSVLFKKEVNEFQYHDNLSQHEGSIIEDVNK
ncbi:sugar transferase [Globicatella sp. PHS-GS-PNBC-21-1553]|uniref:sugar transferase n=1 Tax=Globicatella sp. PHS-GS-PNBC-21-1553 TaxID=2885764 RepID=UPI00298EF2B9|nr:sugar transferase [Globicatella sp. PHS-GS-PNBC-21-1553]WPC09064.1 sugar transferase [Globicatella sp. PHS-GS-PNBC-21-1553]